MRFVEDFTTDIKISTRWAGKPLRRRVEIAFSSNVPVARQRGIDEWIEVAKPELPCFFEEEKADYYLSQDGCRLLVVFEDVETSTYGEGS